MRSAITIWCRLGGLNETSQHVPKIPRRHGRRFVQFCHPLLDLSGRHPGDLPQKNQSLAHHLVDRADLVRLDRRALNREHSADVSVLGVEHFCNVPGLVALQAKSEDLVGLALNIEGLAFVLIAFTT